MQVLKNGIDKLDEHSAYDLVVIGAGTAGLICAAGAATYGAALLAVGFRPRELRHP